jgi:predicted GTPase
VYFVKFAHSDFAKYKLARSFDIFDKYERGIDTLSRKIESGEEITSNKFTNNELTKWLEDYEADRKILIESSNRTFRDLILLEYGIPVVTYLVASGLYIAEVIIPAIQH